MSGKRGGDQGDSHRRGASWVDERKDERGNLRVMQGFSKLRADSAYEAAEDCGDCVQERAEQDDESALCERHLAQAMGMESKWP
jgi:hypothetical protein